MLEMLGIGVSTVLHFIMDNIVIINIILSLIIVFFERRSPQAVWTWLLLLYFLPLLITLRTESRREYLCIHHYSVFDCRSFDVDAGCDFYGVHSGISVIRAGSLYCSGTNGHQWDLQGGFQKNPQGYYCRSLKG